MPPPAATCADWRFICFWNDSIKAHQSKSIRGAVPLLAGWSTAVMPAKQKCNNRHIRPLLQPPSTRSLSPLTTTPFFDHCKIIIHHFYYQCWLRFLRPSRCINAAAVVPSPSARQASLSSTGKQITIHTPQSLRRVACSSPPPQPNQYIFLRLHA
jgi:hypothetical protein